MSVGGVGGAGGAGGGAGTGGAAPAAGGASPAGGAGEVSAVGSTDGVGTDSSKEAGNKDDGMDPNKHSHVGPMSGCGGNMSTQNFVSLHNQSVQQINETQSSEMDLQKLIEMMMAIKLLQEMNKNGQQLVHTCLADYYIECLKGYGHKLFNSL